jgi:hypothetical protein
MTQRFARFRRFRFNLPQRIAAGLLVLFLAQGLWLTGHQTPTERDVQYARCGLETWEPSSVSGQVSSCGKIQDGVLGYRLVGLPLMLNLLATREPDLFSKPQSRVVPGPDLSAEELKDHPTRVLLLMRLPFLLAGCVLGGGLWWVTRRLYGNLGGYTALALYCFSPMVLKACVEPGVEALAALGVYGGVYTCIGVAHAMQGPKRKWRPRIVLLTVLFGMGATSHLVVLPVVALLGLALMLWIAKGRRGPVLPVVLMAVVGALVLVFACCGFSPDTFSGLFRFGAGMMSVSINPVWQFFSASTSAGIIVAAVAALALYLCVKRSRYFGNTAPLLCTFALMALAMAGISGAPWLWALPFLLTFVSGVFTDAYEGPRGRVALSASGAVVLLQTTCCVLSLPGLL